MCEDDERPQDGDRPSTPRPEERGARWTRERTGQWKRGAAERDIETRITAGSVGLDEAREAG